MKLHLPHSLRTALLCAFSLVSTLGTSNTYAAGLHSQVGMVTYTDFGQNMGRYRVNGVNDLLSTIREKDGVCIYYQEGHEDFRLPHYMISYESQGDNGAYAAVGYNFIATVAHNGCQNPTFTGRYINGADSLHYYGVEYRSNITFCLQPGDVVFSSNWAYDFKMTRLNKLITDVTTSDLVPRFPENYDYSQLHGIMEYRAGSGTMTMRHLDRSKEGLTGAYVYVTGAVQKITTGGTTNQQWACFTAGGNLNPSASGINADNPLPFVGAAGDSGSPVWIWDEASESYLYLAAYQSGSDWFGQARGSVNFAWDSLTKFDKLIDMEPGTSQTVHIKGVKATAQDETVTDGTRSTRLHLGRVEDGSGTLLTDYVGVKADNNDYIHTWLNLADEKNSDNWFAYTNKYYNVGSYKEGNVTTQRELDIEDLFNDSNLVFSASSATGNVVEVDEDTDLGIGYLQFSINPESHLNHAEFTLQSNGKTDDGHGGQRDYMVNSAGFVVEQGVDLHVKLTNTQWDSSANDYYYREWRKVGDGNLYLEGSGNNEIFLNVGGPGTTYLKETNGYAAYNVYAASGATVVLDNADVGQIYRDFTFGYTGATLDFNGAGQMDWRFSADAAAAGFNIHSQSEDGIITNSKAGTLFTLTYKEGGEQEYIGSFVDSADGGALKVVFDGGAGSKLTLHSIHTDLTGQDASGLEVNSGNIVLAGTNTKHAMGSRSGRNAERYFSAEDWHFADTKADVLVKDGATFTLGSHARLKGDVTLEQNASLIINEGVLNSYEYIEGGIRKEDTTTDFYRQFYGLKGDIKTVEGSSVYFAFDAATTAEQVYDGNITGGGDILVSLGGGGATLRLSAENSDFSGTKELTGGGLISDKGLAPLGTVTSIDADGNAWHVAADAYIAAKGATGDSLLNLVRQDSMGVLALTQTQEADLNLQTKGYNNLIVGALAGQENVRYGTENAVLSTVQNDGKAQWLLGGGGGNLFVDFALQNKNAELVLGNEYTTGTVTLTNAANSIGAITFKGQVTLEYTSEAALGQADVSLNYTNRLKLLSEGGLASVTKNSSGVVLVDKTPYAAFDLTNYGDLYLGASQDTVLHTAPTVAAGSAYRFGGIEGVLTLKAALQDSGDQATDLIVDGQTFSGGVLELARAAGITGAVEVRGYDAERLPHGVQPHGDITLRLTEDNSLIHASGVTLEDGGILDIHGTSQTVRNLNTEDGSLVTSSTGGGVLTVAGDEDSHIAGVLDLYCVNKQGTGTMVLSGTSLVDMFDVQEGTLRVTAAEALSGLVTVHGNGSLVLPGGTVDAILSLGNGAHVSVTSNATATLGGMELADGATATLQGGTLALPRQATIGSTGTTLKLTGNANLTLSADENMAIHSMLQATGNTTSKVSVSGGSADAHYTRVFDGIIVDQGSTLTLEQTVQETAPTYEIRGLSGQGTLVLSGGSYKDAPTFYKLTRDTEFAGTFKILAGTGYSSHPYMSHTLIQSDNALANAQVQMQGWGSDSAYITLGIDTENASIKGLSTLNNNSRSILMAGATTADTAENIPVSSRRATLTITGSVNNTFQGRVVGGADDTNHGLSIVMSGSGTQTFNGSTVVFNNVSVLDGKLVLNSNELSIKENVTVARGAQLEIHGGWSLDAGHTLHVAGNASENAANMTTALTLNGGTIDFAGTALSTQNNALHLTSLSGSNVTVTLSDTASLQTGTYQLADGDWSGVTVDGTNVHPYYQLTFNRTANGLSVQVAQAGNSYIWNGTTDSHDWSASQFGQHSVTFDDSKTAVFSDAAQERHVNITENVSAGELVFDSSNDYTLAGNYSVSAATLVQMGSGTTDLGGRASISGQATLSDGTLVMHVGDSADSVSIAEKATLRLVDAGVETGTISGAGTLAIALGEGASVNMPTIGTGGIGRLVVESGEALAGATLNVTESVWVKEAGMLTVNPAALDAGVGFRLHLEGSLKINSTENYTLATSLGGSGAPAGRLVITGGGTATVEDAVALNLAEISIEGGSMLMKRNGSSERNIGTLSLSEGREFTLNGSTQPTEALEFAALKLTGASATVSNQNNSEAMVFRSLSGSAEPTTLNLVKRAGSTKITIFEFGGAQNPSADFSGKIVLSSTVSGSRRSAVIVLDDAQVAANASIDLASASSGDAILGLGVNADIVNIAGLESGSSLGSRARVFSGAVEVNADSSDSVFNGDGVDRELVITTAAGADYSYHGSIGPNINLTIDGSGTQRFIGAGISADLNLVGGKTVLDLEQYTGHATVGTGAELRFEGAHTVVSNLIETDGSIRFTGNNAVLELVDGGDLVFNDFRYRDINGNESPDGNGLALGGSVKLFNKGEHASVDLGTASIVYQGNTMELGDDGIARLDAGNSHTYYVRDGVVTYDGDFAAKAAELEIETYHVETAPEKEPAELLVRDSAFWESSATITGSGTLGIDLPGSEFSLNGRLSEIDPLGTLRLYSGMLNVTETLNVAREAFVEERATLTSNTAAFIQDGASLHLAGNLTLNLPGSVTLNTSITGIEDHVGTLALTGGSVTVDKAAALQVGTLDLRQGTMVVHRDGASVREIGTLKLGNNTTFSQNSDSQPSTAMEIGSLVMAGDTATLKEENNSGALAIRSLSHSGSGSATLNLTNSATSTIIATFYLGGADESADDFSGTINLSSTNSGGNRSAAIILNDANVAAHAAVNLASAASSGALLGLGVNAERVEIAGLSSGNGLGNRARVFSGGLGVNTNTSDASLAGDDTVRELAITTASGADCVFNGTIGKNLNITVGGEGSQSLNGNNSAFNGTLTLTGGTLALGNSGIGSASSTGGFNATLEGGTLKLADNTVNLGTGTLVLSGSTTISLDAASTDPALSRYADGADHENGYLTLTVLRAAAVDDRGATLTGAGVLQGMEFTVTDTAITAQAGKSERSYFVNTAVQYGADAPNTAYAQAHTLVLNTPDATLRMTSGLSGVATGGIQSHGGTVSLAEGVTLQAASLHADAATTLAGEGRLELAKGDTTLPQGVGLGQDWTGTVAVSGISFEGGFTCAQLGTGQSWVELKGTSGYFSSTTIGSNLVLAKGAGNWAFEQNNGNDGTTVKFTGKLKGDGNIGRSNETGSTYTYEFSGDIHEWTGSFISRNSNKNKYTMFRVSGDATEVNANLLLGNPGVAYNDFRLEVKNNARFNGRVEVNSITVADGASATLAGNTAISNGIANSGTLTNVGTLELGNITSWSGTLVNAAQGNVVITSKLTAGNIDNSGTITISDLMVGSDARYVDAHGQSSVNGFATSNLDVCAIGVIQNHGGTIMCGTRDVTDEVLGTGRVQDATTHAAYHVNSTDNTVSFSVIDAAADGALEHIAYADGTALKVDNTADGRHLHSSQLSGTGIITLQLQDGAVLEMDSTFTTKLEVASGASATLHVTENATSNTLTGLASGQALAIDGDSSAVLTLAGASSVQGDLLITHSTVKMGNIQSLGAYNRITSIDTPLQRTITVGDQGVLDVNGGETGKDVGYTVTLDGGTLTNTGNDKDFGKRQPVTNLILDSDSTVVAQKTFGLVASGHAATTLALNGNTLEKTGDGTFFIVNSTVDAGVGGRIKVGEGMLNFNGTETGKRGTMEGALELAGGNVAGHIKLGGNISFEGTARSSVVTADIDIDDHDVHFAGDGNISVQPHSSSGENGSGAISGSGAIVKEGAGTTSISGSMAGFNGSIEVQAGIMEIMNAASVNVQDVTISNGTLGVYKDGTVAEANEGTITIKDTKTLTAGKNAKLNANLVMEAGSTLDVSATGGAGLLMGSTVTMSPGGVTLSEADLAAVANLGFMQAYDLFSGVDSFRIGETSYSEIALTGEWVNASEVFSNDLFQSGEKEYYVFYTGVNPGGNGANVGTVYLLQAPEPTTGTLSLLALAALAARRRRR